jgi:hypothetical protein
MGDGASSQLPSGNGPTAMAIPVDGGPPRRMCLGCCLPLARSLLPQTVCGEGGERADALTNQKLYDLLIDVFSMRTFVPPPNSRDTSPFDIVRSLSCGRGSQACGRVGR